MYEGRLRLVFVKYLVASEGILKPDEKYAPHLLVEMSSLNPNCSEPLSPKPVAVGRAPR